jgi:hypothetical protein
MITLRASVLLSAVFTATTFTGSLAQTTTTPDGTEWTDYVLPGTQQAGGSGVEPTYPYQPLFPGAPGSTGVCQGGTLRSDGAWYAVCKCFGDQGCFVTYQSIASYQCPGNEDPTTHVYTPGEVLRVVTAIGRTKRACSKIGIQRTIEIYKTLAPAGQESSYIWNPGPLGGDPTPGDEEVAKLDLGLDSRPNQTTKKVEEPKNSETTPKTNTGKVEEPKKSETTPNTNTGAGASAGKAEKRPRKAVKRTNKKSYRTHAASRTQQQDVHTQELIGIGIGIGLGLGGRGDHRDDRRDFHRER